MCFATATGSCEDIDSSSAGLFTGPIYAVRAQQKWIHLYAEL